MSKRNSYPAPFGPAWVQPGEATLGPAYQRYRAAFDAWHESASPSERVARESAAERALANPRRDSLVSEPRRCVAPLEYYARLGDANRYEVRRGVRVEIGDSETFDGVPILGWDCSVAQAKALTDRLGLRVDWAGAWDARAEEDAGYTEAQVMAPLGQAAEIVARVNDAEEQFCGADATEEREVEGLVMPLCSEHARELDDERTSN